MATEFHRTVRIVSGLGTGFSLRIFAAKADDIDLDPLLVNTWRVEVEWDTSTNLGTVTWGVSLGPVTAEGAFLTHAFAPGDAPSLGREYRGVLRVFATTGAVETPFWHAVLSVRDP